MSEKNRFLLVMLGLFLAFTMLLASVWLIYSYQLHNLELEMQQKKQLNP